MRAKRFDVKKHARTIVREVTAFLKDHPGFRNTRCKGFWHTFEVFTTTHPKLQQYAGSPAAWSDRYRNAKRYIRAEKALSSSATTAEVVVSPKASYGQLTRFRLVLELVDEMKSKGISLTDDNVKFMVDFIRGCGVFEILRGVLLLRG